MEAELQAVREGRDSEFLLQQAAKHHIIDLKFHEVGLRGQRRLFQRSSRCGNTGGFDVLCSAGQSKT